MKVLELTFDGKLSREDIRKYGDVLTASERIKHKSYGLGHLRLKEGNKILTALYDQENNTIKTHFDWTTNGAIIRMRTMKGIYAIGVSDEQIQHILLTKEDDDIYAIPFSPFWALMKLGVRPSMARWFAIRPESFRYGPISIELILTDGEKLVYEATGDLWSDCLSTFGITRIVERIKVVDKRRTVTRSVNDNH